MKRFLLYGLVALGIFSFSSCSEEESITPSSISNVIAEKRPGGVFLKWDQPQDGTIRYTKVSYFDHLAQKEMWRMSTCDTILIPNTRQKFGAYTFTLQPFSATETGGNVEMIDAYSGRATITEVSKEIVLTADQLSSNAQEPKEGSIAFIIDGNESTFFQSAWSYAVDEAHYIQIDLKKEYKNFRFYYAPRNSSTGKPVDFDILVSTDGENWKLVKKFTKESDKLPVSATGSFRSSTLTAAEPFKFLRMVSYSENSSGESWWSLSEFKFYDIDVMDPEAD